MVDTVKELLNDQKGKELPVIHADATISQAMSFMERLSTDILLLKKDGWVKGVVTLYDFFKSPKHTLLKEVMTPKKDMHTVKLSATLGTCVSMVLRHKVRYLPVKSKSGRIIGLISRQEIYKGSDAWNQKLSE